MRLSNSPIGNITNSSSNYYGIWFEKEQTWLTDDSGIVFAVMCPTVAEIQYNLVLKTHPELAKLGCAVKKIGTEE